MNKLLIAVGFVLVVAVAVFFVTRPEPTPQERLAEAAQDASDAIQSAAEELSSAAEEAGDAVREEIETTAEDLSDQMAETAAVLAEEVSDTAVETRSALSEAIEAWRASGIITDDGIDYDAAIATLAESDLSDETKSQMTSLLELLRDAPGEATQKLAELEAALAAN